jgi:hypothetical protein
MAEPQRASSLPDSVPRPRPARRPSRTAAPLRLDETHDLSPPVRAAQPADPLTAIENETADWSAWVRRSSRIWRLAFPSRPPGEWVLMAVLLLGLALNVSFVLANVELSRSDRLLGSAVFLAGLAILVLIEIGRRSGTTSR